MTATKSTKTYHVTLTVEEWMDLERMTHTGTAAAAAAAALCRKRPGRVVVGQFKLNGRGTALSQGSIVTRASGPCGARRHTEAAGFPTPSARAGGPCHDKPPGIRALRQSMWHGFPTHVFRAKRRVANPCHFKLTHYRPGVRPQAGRPGRGPPGRVGLLGAIGRAAHLDAAAAGRPDGRPGAHGHGLRTRRCDRRSRNEVEPWPKDVWCLPPKPDLGFRRGHGRRAGRLRAAARPVVPGRRVIDTSTRRRSSWSAEHPLGRQPVRRLPAGRGQVDRRPAGDPLHPEARQLADPSTPLRAAECGGAC